MTGLLAILIFIATFGALFILSSIDGLRKEITKLRQDVRSLLDLIEECEDEEDS